MSNMNQIASGLYKALTESDKKKPKAYDTKAEVLRLEGDTVWVKIPGGNDETPVQKTNNANVGDTVMVRFSKGKAWLLGNNTSPATDDTRANIANENALIAGNAAKIAISSAASAEEGAQKAWVYADQAYTSAESAGRSAKTADDKSKEAIVSANTALTQLDIIENVVGVLNLLSTHGTYVLSGDSEVQTGLWYFTKEYIKTDDLSINGRKKYYTRSGSGTDLNPYIYTEVQNPIVSDLDLYYEEYYSVVENPTGSPIDNGWYVLTDIDQAIQSYVSSHLALTDDGLFLQFDNSNAKIQITATSVILHGSDGKIRSQYGEKSIIGNPDGFHIEIDDSNINFYNGSINVAYLNSGELYVENSLSFGNFSFYQRKNGHFSLKLYQE